MTAQRIVVGVSGASGSCYAVRLLETLRDLEVETHLVVSKPGAVTLRHETGMTPRDLGTLATRSHPVGDFTAPIASGSFATLGMALVPCSVRSLAEVATGVGTTLLTRAADVTLKERRRLVLLVRESPFTLAHLRNMEQVTLMGGIVAVPAPAFYHHPTSIEALVDDTVARLLDHLGLPSPFRREWQGTTGPAAPEPER